MDPRRSQPGVGRRRARRPGGRRRLRLGHPGPQGPRRVRRGAPGAERRRPARRRHPASRLRPAGPHRAGHAPGQAAVVEPRHRHLRRALDAAASAQVRPARCAHHRPRRRCPQRSAPRHLRHRRRDRRPADPRPLRRQPRRRDVRSTTPGPLRRRGRPPDGRPRRPHPHPAALRRAGPTQGPAAASRTHRPHRRLGPHPHHPRRRRPHRRSPAHPPRARRLPLPQRPGLPLHRRSQRPPRTPHPAPGRRRPARPHRPPGRGRPQHAHHRAARL